MPKVPDLFKSQAQPSPGRKTGDDWEYRKLTFRWSCDHRGVVVNLPGSFPAWVLGTLAVHRDHATPADGQAPARWSISHVPTECRIIHLPSADEARDVASLLWFVASGPLSQRSKGLLDLGLLRGGLAWVKPWLGACMVAGRCLPTLPYEAGDTPSPGKTAGH